MLLSWGGVSAIRNMQSEWNDSVLIGIYPEGELPDSRGVESAKKQAKKRRILN